MPETAYASCGDLSLAYQVFGDGPIEMVFVGPMITHVELFWTLPDFKAFFDQLATYCRIVIFDKAGVGLSDPIPRIRTLDDRAAEIEAVMDAVGFTKAVVFGMSEGGPASLVFTAKRPQRTRALILYGSFPWFTAEWEDLDRDPEVVHARIRSMADEGDEKYMPSIEQIAGLVTMARTAIRSWGNGETVRILFPGAGTVRQRAMLERMCASPGMVRATMQSVLCLDVRPILPTITAPTLVVHARGDLVPVQFGRYLADHIPGARFLEVEGREHAPWATEPDRILGEVEEFLTGGHLAPPQSHRALRTVLFTDIVASTAHAAAAGDERWRATLQRFRDITAEVAEPFDGTVVKNTGDGHLLTFDGPTQAIRCAEALCTEAEALSIKIRAAIHTGECELMDADIGGLAVHIAARILGHSGPGEIVVSRTVRDLVVGSGIAFDERGSVELRGVPGTWDLLAVNRNGVPTGSSEARLLSIPTPGPRTGMRRSDRAMAAVVRHTPWILRGVTRLAPAADRNSLRA